MEDFWKKVSVDKQNIRFQQAHSFSPYSEYSKNWMEETDGVCQITFNALYRYDQIIEPLLKDKMIKEDNKKWLFDVLVHYLTELEYRNGMDLQEIEARKWKKRIETGEFGEKIAQTFSSFSLDDQYYIVSNMEKERRSGASVYLFSDTLIHVMHDGIIYKDKKNEKELLFYYNVRKKNSLEDKIEMISELFLPLGYSVRVFWESHFAVLGCDQTMEIDQMEIL